MFMNLSGIYGRRQRGVLRKALVNCCALALGTALACAGAASAGAATRPHPVRTGSLHLVRHLPSGKAGVSPADEGYTPVTSGYDGLCLDAETDSGGNPDESGDKVQLWTCNSGATQQYWNISATFGSYGPITNEYGDHLCLDAETDSGGNPDESGDKVQLWTCNSGAIQQKWELYSVSDGSYAFVNEYDTSTLIVLTAENDSGGSPSQCGDNVQVQTWAGQTDQTWNFGDNSSQCS
jgi:hypothetical protein